MAADYYLVELDPQGNVNYKPQAVVVTGTTISTTTLATQKTVMSLTRDCRVMTVRSSCDKGVWVTIGPTSALGIELFYIETGDQLNIEGDTNGIRLKKGTVVGTYNGGSSPTSGTLRVSVF